MNSSKVSSACSLRRATEVLKEFAAGKRVAIRGMATGRAAVARTKVAEPRAAMRRMEAEGIFGEIKRRERWWMEGGEAEG